MPIDPRLDLSQPTCPRVLGVEVHRLAALHAGGASVEALAADYPGLSPELIQVALAYAQAHPGMDVPFPTLSVKQALCEGGLDAWGSNGEEALEERAQVHRDLVAAYEERQATGHLTEAERVHEAERAHARQTAAHEVESPEASFGASEEADTQRHAQQVTLAQAEHERYLDSIRWDPAFLDLSNPRVPRLSAPAVDLATLAALHAGGASVPQLQKYWPAYSSEAIENALAYLRAHPLT